MQFQLKKEVIWHDQKYIEIAFITEYSTVNLQAGSYTIYIYIKIYIYIL